jgi:superfamily II DNA/RNA helicase
MNDVSAPEGAGGFEALGLSPEILRAIAESGYTQPTPIQAAAIPVVLQGRDVLGIAQTGTGKTASFTLPMIEILSRGRAKARMPRTLILEPTRELAAQVAESFDKYGKYHKLTKALLIGGVSFGDQDALLSQGVDVLIATPGRLLDHFERGRLLLSGVQVMVVDEADRMLDMGFIPDIERIFKLTPFTRQTLFFSATMPPEITRLTDQFLSNPQRIEASKPATAATTITQRVVKLPGGDPRTRRAGLRAVLNASGLKNGIVFCNRKTDVDIVAKSLQRHGFNAAPLHGDLDQRTRMATLDRFRTGELQLLIASDVAARGLDIPDVSHVFNYEPSRHADDYIHRIGRTGRAGKSGASFTLIAPGDSKYLQAIEKLLGAPIETTAFEGVPSERLGDETDMGGRGRRREERLKDDRRRHKRGREDDTSARAAAPVEELKRPAPHESAPHEPAAHEPAAREPTPRALGPREPGPREPGPRLDRGGARPRGEQRTERVSDRRHGGERHASGEAARGEAPGFGGDAPAFLTRGDRRFN